MTANVYELQIVPKRLFIAAPQFDVGAVVEYPGFIVLMDINRAVEFGGPFNHVAVKVRVRKGDGFQSAFAVDELLSCIVKQRDTIPQKKTTQQQQKKRTQTKSKRCSYSYIKKPNADFANPDGMGLFQVYFAGP